MHFFKKIINTSQEQPKEPNEQDDDQSHPAFIPRKGAFYEHDLRRDMNSDDEQEDLEKTEEK